jgi:hypothetical protein
MLDRNKSMKNGFVGKEKKSKVEDILFGNAVQIVFLKNSNKKFFLLKFNMFCIF